MALKVQQDRKPYLWLTKTSAHWEGKCRSTLVYLTNRSITSAMQDGVLGEFPHPPPSRVQLQMA